MEAVYFRRFVAMPLPKVCENIRRSIGEDSALLKNKAGATGLSP